MHPKIKIIRLQEGISFEIGPLTPERENRVAGAIRRSLYLSDLPVSDEADRLFDTERIQVNSQWDIMEEALAMGDLATAATAAGWLAKNLKTLSEVLPQRTAPSPPQPRLIPFTVHTEE